MLVAQMIVKNEGSRPYLKQCLDSLSSYVDRIIILDDASDDGITVDLCKSYFKVILYERTTSLFNTNEGQLRNELWEYTRNFINRYGDKDNKDWIISIDADEVFNKDFTDTVRDLIVSDYEAITVKLCDMWNENEYRIDGWWSPLITRVYKFKDEDFGVQGTLHCGCIPSYVIASKKVLVRADIRLKHLSYIADEDKDRKFSFYLGRTRGFNLQHALTIKTKPTLKKFNDTFEYPTVLIGMLVRDRGWCLDRVLAGLNQQAYDRSKLKFVFLVNDSKDDSLTKIREFKDNNIDLNIIIEELEFGCANKDHVFPDEVIQNLALMRNHVLELGKNMDHVFLIDSDLVLENEQTLRHLASMDKDVISEVFWATWGQENGKALPNVWIRGGYETSDQFIHKLKTPGIYECGGLGACTLISKKSIAAGVNYSRVGNLSTSMRGEDRDYCVRANVLNFQLFADTYFTPKHLEKYLECPELVQAEKEAVKEVITEPIIKVNRMPISASMIVKDEGEWLEGCLESIKDLVSELVIVDTGSTDNTKGIAKKYGAAVYDYKWDDSFANARNFSLSKCTQPWVIRIDADEIIPNKTAKFIEDIVTNSAINVDLVLFAIHNYRDNPNKVANANYITSETIRLFRNMQGLYFSGRVHEELDDSYRKLSEMQRVIIVKTLLPFHHFGYLQDKDELGFKYEYYAHLMKLQLKDNPKDYKAWSNLAVHHMSKGNLKKARKYHRKALDVDNRLWVSWNALGVIEYREAVASIADRLDLAKKYYNKAVSLVPKNGVLVHESEKIDGNIKAVDNLFKR